jgi:hypothetical protein
MTSRTLLAVLLTAIAVSHTAQGADGSTASNARAKSQSERPDQKMSAMKIRMTINGKAITATLADNPTARDFFSLLPMTLAMDDYAATEKISYLPRKLATDGAPAGIDPAAGDIAYYAPWGNLAIFYKDFRCSEGLIKLGRMDSGAQALNVPGSIKVTIEPLD